MPGDYLQLISMTTPALSDASTSSSTYPWGVYSAKLDSSCLLLRHCFDPTIIVNWMTHRILAVINDISKPVPMMKLMVAVTSGMVV